MDKTEPIKPYAWILRNITLWYRYTNSPISGEGITPRRLIVVTALYRCSVLCQIYDSSIRRARNKLPFVLRVVFVSEIVFVFECVRVVGYAGAVVVGLDVGGHVEIVDVTVLPIEV